MDPVRSTRRFVARIPGIGLASVAPNTAAFLARSWVRSQQVPVYPGLPAARPTPGMAAAVALDELMLGIMRSPRSHPHRPDYSRVGAELHQALEMYTARGWIADLRAYHRPPAVPGPVTTAGGESRGVPYEWLSWESTYEPHPGEPGRERWLAFGPNRRAHAYLVRAPRSTGRWLVCIHGFGMGSPLTDFHAFRARQLSRDLGANLAFPVLPLHGPRKVTRMSGTAFMSFEMMHPVLGLAQTAADVRALMSWLEVVEGATSVGMYGISLGGYASALIAGLDPRVDLVIAGIPATDFPRLFRHHAPPALRRRALQYGMLGEVADTVHRVVSPLAVEPYAPVARRFIYAALGDRMSTPQQAHALWSHWGRPRIEWLDGAHVTSVMRPSVERFVTEALGAPAAPPDPGEGAGLRKAV